MWDASGQTDGAVLIHVDGLTGADWTTRGNPTPQWVVVRPGLIVVRTPIAGVKSKITYHQAGAS